VEALDAELAYESQLPTDVVAHRRLLAAVLHRAMLDYANAMALQSQPDLLYLTEWFTNDEPYGSAEGGLSFPWVCEMLGMDHTQLRRKLFDHWRTVAHHELAALERKQLRKQAAAELMAA
jgi:hypothetical protein